jgi:hypothetical protein
MARKEPDLEPADERAPLWSSHVGEAMNHPYGLMLYTWQIMAKLWQMIPPIWIDTNHMD